MKLSLLDVISRSKGAIVVASAIATFSDLLKPLAPFSTIIMVASVFIVLALLFVIHALKKENEVLWVSVFFTGALFLSSTGFFIYQQTDPTKKEKGVLASNFELLQVVQSDLGLIKEDISLIASSTASMDRKMDGLKKEVSKDPKKELANRGIAWTKKRFLEAITDGDLETLKLFVEGGFKTNLYAGTDQNHFISIIHDIPKDRFDKTLIYLVEQDYIIPNQPITIYTMGDFEDPQGIRYAKVGERSYQYYMNIATRVPMLKVNLLSIAVWDGDIDRVKKLLQIGENPNFKGRLDSVDENSELISPISEANFLGKKEILSILLDD